MEDDKKDEPLDNAALRKLLSVMIDNQANYTARIVELSEVAELQAEVVSKLSKAIKDLQKNVVELKSKQSKKALILPPTVAKLYN